MNPNPDELRRLQDQLADVERRGSGVILQPEQAKTAIPIAGGPSGPYGDEALVAYETARDRAHAARAALDHHQQGLANARVALVGAEATMQAMEKEAHALMEAERTNAEGMASRG